MENTGLTTGRDKYLPFRVLVVGHVGFGHLFIQLGSASLPTPPLATREFCRLRNGSQVPVILGREFLGTFVMHWSKDQRWKSWGCLAWQRQKKQEV